MKQYTTPDALPPLRKDIPAHLAALQAYLDTLVAAGPEEMTNFFLKRLNGYDTHMLSNFPCYDQLASLVPYHAARILDLGCGTGLELDAIFARFEAAGKALPAVTGIDLTAAMLDELRKKHAEHAIQLICGSYFDVPFGENAFDIVISAETIHHFSLDEKLPLFEKIYRALTPGGSYIQFDYFASCDEDEAICEAAYQRCVTAGYVSAGTFVHIDRPKTPAHEADILRKAGFSHVTFYDTGCEGNIILAAHKEEKTINHSL